eukprot:CAMPEP_0201100632 /NCGR_PEP_ID=MMETSP0812-20130820/9468_1 /ASSEMBLY_ACC=CAM_ASM_000668 /TAXON_ID=98059 /ORGANISM="Dinobryon sp., Strain UTEXLB2267" /LENGTH=75 /DNA_ID=CAMNT_0047357037 /DNA_START=370 /DNA_END=593 /DNA_ORIENTATION=+
MTTDDITNKMSFTGPAKLITIDDVLLTSSNTDILRANASSPLATKTSENSGVSKSKEKEDHSNTKKPIPIHTAEA